MRRRLILLGLSTVITVLAAVGVPFAIVQAEFQILRQVDKLETAAVATAADAAVLLPTRLTNAISQILENRSVDDRLVLVRNSSLSVSSRGFAGSSAAKQLEDTATKEWLVRIESGLTPPRPDVGLLPKGYLMAAAPIRVGEETVGVAVVFAPSDPLRSSIYRAWGALLVGGFVLTLLTAAASIPITRWIVRPINRLDSAMRRVAEGAESARVVTTDGPQEIRSLAESFNVMANDVQTAMQRQRSFAADASHQLRNPLTALRLRVEDLELQVADGGAPNSVRTTVSRVAKDVDRMKEIVEQLLALAQAERKIELIEERPNLVVLDRVADWGALAAAREISLKVDQLPTEPAVGQRGGLGQVLDVLLDNAVKFSPERSAVRISGFVTTGHVCLEVSDEGPGFSSDELLNATRRFWRSDRSTSAGGYGLGLAIAEQLLHNVGGELELGEGEHGGAKATVRLLRASAP